MSTAGQNIQQLRQEIQHELITANHLLRQIHTELQTIKSFSDPGGKFESSLKDNASLITRLAQLRRVDLTKIPPMVRQHIVMDTHENQNTSFEGQNSISEVDISVARSP